MQAEGCPAEGEELMLASQQRWDGPCSLCVFPCSTLSMKVLALRLPSLRDRSEGQSC